MQVYVIQIKGQNSPLSIFDLYMSSNSTSANILPIHLSNVLKSGISHRHPYEPNIPKKPSLKQKIEMHTFFELNDVSQDLGITHSRTTTRLQHFIYPNQTRKKEPIEEKRRKTEKAQFRSLDQRHDWNVFQSRTRDENRTTHKNEDRWRRRRIKDSCLMSNLITDEMSRVCSMQKPFRCNEPLQKSIVDGDSFRESNNKFMKKKTTQRSRGKVGLVRTPEFNRIQRTSRIRRKPTQWWMEGLSYETNYKR